MLDVVNDLQIIFSNLRNDEIHKDKRLYILYRVDNMILYYTSGLAIASLVS